MARVTADSMASQIRNLSNGQSYSRTKRIAIGEPEGSTAAALKTLRNLINQAVGRARYEVAGSDFRVDSGIAVTADQSALLCTVAVTRFDGDVEVEDEEDDDLDI